MRTKYVSPKQWQRISKGKEVKSFPNPVCKEIDGERYVIVDNPTCEIHLLEEKHYPWYLRMSVEDFQKQCGNEKVYFLKVKGDCSFPTDLIAGTIKWGCYRRYSMETALSKKTGWLSGVSKGSETEAFLGSKVNTAIEILRKHGFMFDFIQI